ncbi:MAG: hypothetical protein JWL98_1549 [Xanthomonadaceae bacterium]|nr:hypothetical protein [Xanthomonadaceae bacterium]
MTPAAPASFWRRYAAYSLDFVVLALLATLLSWSRLEAGWHRTVGATEGLTQTLRGSLETALAQGVSPDGLSSRLLQDVGVQAGAAGVQAGLMAMLLPWLLVYAIAAALYHIGFERSPWAGSPGKHALQLRVVDAHGDVVPGLLQTLVRHVAGALSWLTLNLGHALAAVPPQKRALHDYVAGTRVVSDNPSLRLPAWARAWLWLQVIAVVGLIAVLVLRDIAALQGSLA